MIRQSTIELLKEMRFSAMASELERQLADEETYREMSFEDRLAMLVDAEWNRRQANKYTRCLHTGSEQNNSEQSRKIIIKWNDSEIHDT